MSEFEIDSNIDHFQRPKDMQENYSKISPEVYDEFVDLISSITSEFSGCVLYAEIKKRVKNDDMKKLLVIWQETNLVTLDSLTSG